MNSFPFDEPIDRLKTGAMKWEKYAGQDVLPMWVADMEFATAPEITSAMKARLDHPILGYTVAKDTHTDTVVNYLNQHHQWNIDPEWLVWLPGVVPGLAILTEMLASDEQIMVFTPVYHPLLIIPDKYNRQRIDVPLQYENKRWTIDFDRFEQSITKRCKMLFLCSPHNPVGTIFTEPELKRIVEICAANNILVVSDEIHCDLILQEHKRHCCTGVAAADAGSHVLTLMSPSKTFNLAGANCSFAIVPDPQLRNAFKQACLYTLPVVPTLSYTAAEAAYTHGWDWHRQLIDYLRGNLTALHNAVNDIPFLSMDDLDATYLAWIKTADLPVDDPFEFFLQAGVGLSPGAQFGDANYQRLNFACSRQQLNQAIERIREAVGKIS